jgi:hypothetical protein
VSVRPPLAPDRLGDAVTLLAERVSEPDVRAQLHALAGIVRNLGADPDGERESAELEAGLLAALEAGDEARVVAAARALTAAERARVTPLDWSAASGG